LEKNDEILWQLIGECATLEDHCQREETALKVDKAEARKLDAQFRALQKEWTDEFSFKPAKKKTGRNMANEQAQSTRCGAWCQVCNRSTVVRKMS
jgi:hypothetical protein